MSDIRSDLVVARSERDDALDAIRSALVALEGLSAELERLGHYGIADAVQRAEMRLAHAAPDSEPAPALAAWG